MKKLLPQFALLFLLLLPLLGWAQEIHITGRVVDAKTKEPIPFASLSLLKASAGALTGENGYFQLIRPDGFKQDSLVVMTLGYDRKALFVEQAKMADLRIEMASLPTGWIIGCPVKPDKVSAKNTLTTNDLVITGLPGTQYAFFVENDKRKQARKMRSVSFYIGENGLPLAPFRVRFYKLDGSNQTPASDLLTERIVLMPAKSGQWFTTDLSRYRIAVPKEGYFVALEFEAAANQSPQPILDNYVPAGQIMRPPFDFKKSKLWSYTSEMGWNLFPQSSSSRRYNAMIKVEVEAVD